MTTDPGPSPTGWGQGQPAASPDPNWRWMPGGWQYWGGDGWWYQRDPDIKGARWRQGVDGTWQYLAVDGYWHLPPSPEFLAAQQSGTGGWGIPPGESPALPSQASALPAAQASNKLSRLAIILGSAAVLVWILGIAAIVLGIVAVNRKEPLARAGLLIAVTGLVAGLILEVVALRVLHGT